MEVECPHVAHDAFHRVIAEKAGATDDFGRGLDGRLDAASRDRLALQDLARNREVRGERVIVDDADHVVEGERSGRDV